MLCIGWAKNLMCLVLFSIIVVIRAGHKYSSRNLMLLSIKYLSLFCIYYNYYNYLIIIFIYYNYYNYLGFHLANI